jgi:hypothetical protein
LWSKRFLSHAQCLLAQCFVGQGIVSEHSRLEVDSHHTSLRTGSRRTQPVRCSEAIERNEAYESFSAAC